MSIVERAINKASGRAKAGESAGGSRSAAGNSAAPHGRLALDGKATVDIRLERLRELGLAPASDAEKLVAEELRVIKRPLLLNAEGGDAAVADGKLVMIASALPGAGKTFTSLNLALSMASELDWSVLLVDADVSRPTLSRGLGLAEAPGLVGLLEQEGADLADFVFGTDHPRLYFLPSGSSRHAKELLGSQRMRAFAGGLAESSERRIVLFDSPPLLLTSEARVLASYVGQIVVVVEAGVTSRRALLEAVDVLDRSKAINLLLNKNRQLPGIEGYYYAGYEPHDREAAS